MKKVKKQTSQVAPIEREQMKIVIVGHVDHGKSTLVGRIFYDTDSLPDGKYEQIQAMCRKRGMPFEWAFLMDALQSERDQGITIDTSQIWFKTAHRDYVIIDAPGHKEFLKNMISGAANSEAALLIIDAKEGVQEQSKRHGYLLHLLGIEQVAVAVNKMDLVGYSEAVFRNIEKEYTDYLFSIGVKPTYVIPIAAREGDLIVKASKNMPWYKGPSVIEALDHFKKKPALQHLPLRFPVQDVYKFDERRILVGRIESGVLKVGDVLLFSPSNKVSRVRSIEAWGTPIPPREAHAGEAVGITLEEQIFVERGAIASHEKVPPILTNLLRARIFWLGRKPLKQGARLKMKLSTSEYRVDVRDIEQVVDTNNLAHEQREEVVRNTVAEIVIHVRGLAALDEFSTNAKTGRFVLLDDYEVVGGGIIYMEGFSDQRVKKREMKSDNLYPVDMTITREQRAYANGHLGGILWFSGLSGSGKTTIARELEKRLFARGYQVYVLDGDNIRGGLNSDLGFTPPERAENLRRVGEVAALFAKAGFIVVTAFISPYASERKQARAMLPESFHSVYIKAQIATCEKRDPKGLYQKARKGEIKHFTGVSDVFEVPENADVVVDTEAHVVEENLQLLENYVEDNFVAPLRSFDKKENAFPGSDI